MECTTQAQSNESRIGLFALYQPVIYPMQKYFNTILDEKGDPIGTASVLVKTPAGDTATIYSDNSGTTTGNPLSTSSTGYFEFYAPNGLYSIVITKIGKTTITIDNILLDDPTVATIAALKAAGIPTTANVKVTVVEDGRAGDFYWVTGDQSANVTADTQSGIWVAPDSAPTGASGAWKRVVSTGFIDARCFGVTLDGSTADATALAAALSVCSTNRLELVLSARSGAAVSIINAEVALPTFVRMRAEGDVTLRFTSTSTERGLVASTLLSSDSYIRGIKFTTTGTVNQFINGGTGSTDIEISGNDFNFAGATSGPASSETGGIHFINVSNLEIRYNKFANSWRDILYDASDEGGVTGNNLLRAINISNTAATAGDVKVHHNDVDDVWTFVYTDNVNDLRVERNNIDTTASTAIFDRCTAGISYNKWIQYNKLKNLGKSAIKILDTNNLNGKGHNGWAVGNEIENWGLYVAGSGAILSANYYDFGVTNAYLEAPDGSRSKGLRINKNVIRETSASSCGVPFQVLNQDRAVITENEVDLLTTAVTTIMQWCPDAIWARNTMKTAGWFKVFDCDRVKVDNNTFEMDANYFEFDNQIGLFSFTNNTVNNSNASQTTAYGVLFSQNNTYVAGVIAGNTFITALAVQDDDENTNVNIVRLPSDTSAVAMDNNLVQFDGATTGTATAGGASTIQLAVGTMNQDDAYNGATITITGGTGSGQTRTISDYVGNTRTATVSVAWVTVPDATSTYSITGGQVLIQNSGFGTLKYPRYFGAVIGNATWDIRNAQLDVAKSNTKADTGAITVGADTA